MRRRRTKEEIMRERVSLWGKLADSWHMYTACSVCEEVSFVRGKQRDSVKCKTCHMEGK